MLRTMNKKYIKSLMGLALVMLISSSCKDSLYDDYKTQAVDNHGHNQGSMVSTAVTSSALDEFYVNAVDGVNTEVEVTLIPVILSGSGLSGKDVHVKFEPALDSLDAYNTRNETEYVMPGDVGSPAFTLVDDGVVTIKAGTEVGYLKVKLVPSDYFGDVSYAFAYKIASVQEGGYTISGNHNHGIIAILPKNAYDGIYHETGTLVRQGNPVNNLDTDTHLATVNTTTVWAYAGFPVFQNTTLSYYATINNDNTVTITADPHAGVVIYPIAADSNPGSGSDAHENSYDPATKTFYLNYEYLNGSGLKRTFHTTMVLE